MRKTFAERARDLFATALGLLLAVAVPATAVEIYGVPATISGAKTFNDTVTFNKTAESGIAEVLSTWKVTDDATSKIEFANSVSTNGQLAPIIKSTAATAGDPALFLRGIGPDSGSAPGCRIDVRTTGNSAFSTRSIFDITNAGTAVLTGLPLNSGANLALSWGTQATNTPAFTNRSAGTRIILRESMSGSTTDIALGCGGTGQAWLSLPDATSARDFKIYGGTTNLWQVRGDGRVEETGAHMFKVRVATTTPVTVASGTDYQVITKLGTPGAVAVNLPASPATGLTYVIQDGTGDAAANNITITPAAGTINGAATLVINANYGAKVLTYSGTEWLAR